MAEASHRLASHKFHQQNTSDWHLWYSHLKEHWSCLKGQKSVSVAELNHFVFLLISRCQALIGLLADLLHRHRLRQAHSEGLYTKGDEATWNALVLACNAWRDPSADIAFALMKKAAIERLFWRLNYRYLAHTRPWQLEFVEMCMSRR